MRTYVSLTLLSLSCMDYMQKPPPNPVYEAVPAADLNTVMKLDEFVVETTQEVDILFIVDKSGSMLDDALEINSNLPTFLFSLDDLWLDYRIGVISTDAGPGHGGVMGRYQEQTWISSGEEEAAFKFSMMLGSVGTEGEEGHDALLALLEGDEIYQMLRYQVPLEVVVISDEADQSDASWSEVLAKLRLVSWVKGAPIRYSAIVQFPAGELTCVSDFAVFSDGSEYMVLAEILGGAQVEICDQDWAETFSNLMVYDRPDPTYYLSQRPEEETLEVLISVAGGGLVFNPQPPNWTYDSASNSVTVVNFPVPAGAIVSVSYIVASGELE